MTNHKSNKKATNFQHCVDKYVNRKTPTSLTKAQVSSAASCGAKKDDHDDEDDDDNGDEN